MGVRSADQWRIQCAWCYFFLVNQKIATAAMRMPNNHSQYFAKKPGVSVGWIGWAITGIGVGTGATAAGACCTTGTGAATGSGSGALGAATFALCTVFLAFLTTGLGAGGSVMAAGAGTGAGSTTATGGAGAGSGAAGVSTAITAGAGSATASCLGLVEQADKANAEISRATGNTLVRSLDMELSKVMIE